MPFDPTKPFEVVGTEPTGFDPNQPFTVVAEPPSAKATAPAFDPSKPFEVVQAPALQPVTTPARDLVTNPPQIQPSPRPPPTFQEMDPAVALLIEHGKAARSSLYQTGRGASAALEGLAAGAQSTAEALGLEAKDSARFGIVDALKAGAADSRAFYEEKLADPALQQDPSIRNATYAERPFAKAGLAATSQALPFATGLAASAAAGNPAPMMALYATTGYGDTYANAKQAGASETAAQTTAMVNAAWQGISERFGIGGLLEAPKRTILANIAAGATRESIQEAIQTIGSNIIESIGYDAGRQWTEGLADAIAGAFVLGAGGGATIRPGQPPAPGATGPTVQAAQPGAGADPNTPAGTFKLEDPRVPVSPVDRNAGLFQPPVLDGAPPIVLPAAPDPRVPVSPVDRQAGLFQPADLGGAPPITLPGPPSVLPTPSAQSVPPQELVPFDPAQPFEVVTPDAQPSASRGAVSPGGRLEEELNSQREQFAEQFADTSYAVRTNPNRDSPITDVIKPNAMLLNAIFGGTHSRIKGTTFELNGKAYRVVRAETDPTKFDIFRYNPASGVEGPRIARVFEEDLVKPKPSQTPQPAPVSNDTTSVPFDPTQPFTVVEQPTLIDQPRTQKNLSTERAQINRILDELDKAEAAGRGRPYVYDDLVRRVQHIDTMLYDQAMGRGASAYEFPRTSSRREAEEGDYGGHLGARPSVDAIGWLSNLTIPENVGFADLQELSRQVEDALAAQPSRPYSTLEEDDARAKLYAQAGKIETRLMEHPDNPDNRPAEVIAPPSAIPVAGTTKAQSVRSPEPAKRETTAIIDAVRMAYPFQTTQNASDEKQFIGKVKKALKPLGVMDWEVDSAVESIKRNRRPVNGRVSYMDANTLLRQLAKDQVINLDAPPATSPVEYKRTSPAMGSAARVKLEESLSAHDAKLDALNKEWQDLTRQADKLRRGTKERKTLMSRADYKKKAFQELQAAEAERIGKIRNAIWKAKVEDKIEVSSSRLFQLRKKIEIAGSENTFDEADTLRKEMQAIGYQMAKDAGMTEDDSAAVAQGVASYTDYDGSLSDAENFKRVAVPFIRNRREIQTRDLTNAAKKWAIQKDNPAQDRAKKFAEKIDQYVLGGGNIMDLKAEADDIAQAVKVGEDQAKADAQAKAESQNRENFSRDVEHYANLMKTLSGPDVDGLAPANLKTPEGRAARIWDALTVVGREYNGPDKEHIVAAALGIRPADSADLKTIYQKAMQEAFYHPPTKSLPAKVKLRLADHLFHGIKLQPLPEKVKASDTFTAVVDARSTDETRYVLNGVFHDADRKALIATDGKHLQAVQDKTVTETKIIGVNKAGKKTGLLDGEFPNYAQVIPSEATVMGEIAPDQLLAQANAIEKFASRVLEGGETGAIFGIGDKFLNLDAQFVADAARMMLRQGVKTVQVLTRDPMSPILFIGDGINGKLVSVVMPLRREGPGGDLEFRAREQEWNTIDVPASSASPKAIQEVMDKMRSAFKLDAKINPAKKGKPAPSAPADAPINSIPRAYDPDPPVLNGVRVDTNAPVGTGDIVRFIAKAFDVPLRVGGFRRAAEGFYRSFSENIRLKRANEIPVAFHELGHYLHNVVFPGNPDQDARGSRTQEYSTFGKRFDTELMPLGTPTSRPSYSEHQIRMEGVAEFLRVYMGNRADALTQAPTFTAHFEAETAKQPELRAAIDKAREMVTKWRQQPAGARIDAHIRTSEDGRRTYTPRQIVGNLYTKWVDQTAPITRTLENMVEAGASPGLARAIQARIVNFIGGWRGKVEHALNNRATNLRGQEVGEGLRTILRDAAKAAPPSLLAPGQRPLELFRRYVVAKHAKEDLFPRGIETGLNRSDVEHEVATLGPVFESHFRRLLAFQRVQRDLLVDAGVISRETARAMDAKHQWYVPFHRFHEGVAGRSRGGSGTGFINTPTGIRRMKGSTREILDPIETIIKNAYVFRELAERNRIGEAFARFLDTTRGGGRIGDQVSKKMAPTKVNTEEIVKMLNDAGVDPDLVEQVADAGPSGNIWRAIDSVKPRDGIFKVYRDGKEVHYQIDDGELYRAMTLADTTDAEILARFPFLRSFNWFTRLKRAGATLTPEFILRNPIRDQFAAAIYSKDGTYIPFVDMFRGMFHVLRKDGVYQRWVREGGRYAHMVGADKTNLQESLEEVMREPGAAAFITEMMNPLHPIRTLQNISTLMEESTRVGIFGKAMRSGASPIVAANLSKDGTLNFSRHGTHGKLVNMLSAFFNAGVQDLDKLVRAHTDRSTAPGVAMRGFLYITIPSLLTWFLGKDDDEIQNLPGWRKNLAWNFRIPGLDGIWSLPKPFLLGSIYGTSVERALDVIYKDDPAAAGQWFDSVLGQLPGGGPGPKESMFIPPGMIPDVIKTAIEGMANYSFFREGPIIPQRLLDLPKAEQYTETTSRAGRAVGQVTGISPMLVDNAIRNTFAGLGKVGLDVLDASIIKLSGEELPPSPARPAVETTPGLRAFKVPEGEASRKIEEFYTGIHNAEALWKAAQAKDPVRDIKWYKSNQVGLLYYHERLPDLRRLGEYMADLNTARRAVVGARDMTPAKKQAALVKLSQERERVAKAGVSMMLPADITRRR